MAGRENTVWGMSALAPITLWNDTETGPLWKTGLYQTTVAQAVGEGWEYLDTQDTLWHTQLQRALEGPDGTQMMPVVDPREATHIAVLCTIHVTRTTEAP